MKKNWVALLLVGCAPLASFGQTADRLYVAGLAATCANCHGTQGRTTPGSTVAPLAGLPRDHLATQLKAFKTGSRPATIMHQLAKGYSDAQIEQLADYFAALPR